MNNMLNDQNVPKQQKPIPSGLPNLMTDIAREVLRAQTAPDETLNFIAGYINSLIRVRERTFIVQNVVEELIRNSTSLSEVLASVGISYKKANQAAKIIHCAFREYLETSRKPQPSNESFNEYELLLDLVQKCRFSEEEICKAKPCIRKAFREFVSEYLTLIKSTIFACAKESSPATFTMAVYAKYPSSLENLHKAAILIQAAFRGYIARKSLKKAGGGSKTNNAKAAVPATPAKQESKGGKKGGKNK